MEDITEGIERYIKYIRRMSLLTDEQLAAVLGRTFVQSPDSYIGTGIGLEGHIEHIRKMSMHTDDQLREYLRRSAEDPVMLEIFKDAAKKKAIQDMKKMAKDITGDPRKFARKVDREY